MKHAEYKSRGHRAPDPHHARTRHLGAAGAIAAAPRPPVHAPPARWGLPAVACLVNRSCGSAPQSVLLRGVALGAGTLAVLAACSLRAAASWFAAVDGLVAALVALLRLGAILLRVKKICRYRRRGRPPGRGPGPCRGPAWPSSASAPGAVSCPMSPGSGNRHAGSGPVARVLGPSTRAQIVQLPLTHAPSQLWPR